MKRPAFHIPEDAGSILIGATGRIGRKHMVLMRTYGTNIVAGVTPRVDEHQVNGVPMFGNCVEAAKATGARMAVAMVPPMQVLDAVHDAVAAGIELLVTVTEGMPIADAVKARVIAREAGISWVGPSTPGIAIPGRLKLGFLPDVALAPGFIGFASKSGTLSYEVGYRLVSRGFGQSVWVGVGGDPVKGTRFADVLPYFEARPDTKAVVIVGEIGGEEEEELARAIVDRKTRKPVYAIIAGQSAREGISMGHAGALIDGTTGTIQSKKQALESAGAYVFTDIKSMVDAIARDFADRTTPEERNVSTANR